MRLFITGKHWQVFLVLFVLPFTLSLFTTLFVLFNIFVGLDPESAIEANPFILLKAFVPFLILIVVNQWLLFAWHTTLGNFFTSLLPPSIVVKRSFFKICSLFTPVVFTAFAINVWFLFKDLPLTQNPEVFFEDFLQPSPALFSFIGLYGLLLISPIALVYILYFLSRTFKYAELQKEVSFSEYLGEFIMFWFFPIIGVFLLQNKINDLAAGKHLETPNDQPFEYQN